MFSTVLSAFRAIILLVAPALPLSCKQQMDKVNTRTGVASNTSETDRISDDARKNVFPIIGMDQNGNPVDSPALSFTADGKSILAQTAVNATVEVAWDAPTLEQCTVLPQGWTGLTGKQSVTVAYDQMMTLTCTKGGQLFSKTLSLVVTNAATPALSITASAAGKTGSIIVPTNTNVTIAWEAANVDSCTVQPSGWTGTQGNKTLVVDRSTAFILECMTRGVRSSNFAVVNVDPKGDVIQQVVNPDKYSLMELEINDSLVPITVAYNAKVRLAWSSSNMQSCSLNPGAFTGLTGTGASGNLTASTIFILECVSKANTRLYQVGLVNVGPPLPPTVTMTVDGVVAPVTLQRTATTTVAWKSESAESCKLMSLNKGQLATGLSGSLVVNPLLSSDIYYVLCTGLGGTRAAFAPVNIPIAPPLIEFLANGQSGGLIINAGTAVSLSWKASNVDSCSLMPVQQAGLTGTYAAGKVNQSVVYVLECKGPLGNSNTSLPIVIQPQSMIGATLSANGTVGALSVDYGTDVRLLWTSVNATNCNLTPGGPSATTGEFRVAGMTQSATYTLTCSAAGMADATSKIAITVNTAKVPEVNFLANGRNGTVQLETTANVTLTWDTRYANSCTLDGQAVTPVVSGSRVIENFSQDRTFNFVCTGAGGTTQQTIVVKAAIDCNTRSSIVDPSDQYSFVNRENIRDFVNRTGKFEQMIEVGMDTGALGFSAAAALLTCRLKGYFEVVSTKEGYWKSTWDNKTAHYIEATKILEIVESDAPTKGRNNNSLLDGVTCRGRVIDRCRTDTRWFLGR